VGSFLQFRELMLPADHPCTQAFDAAQFLRMLLDSQYFTSYDRGTDASEREWIQPVKVESPYHQPLSGHRHFQTPLAEL
jgi:hypothetical protein